MVAEESDIDLKVYFCSDVSTRSFVDVEGFGKEIKWDIPLLEGYAYEFLPAKGSTDEISFWKPSSFGLTERLKHGQFDVLWIHGYGRYFNLRAMLAAKMLGMRVLLRDEANLISAPRGTRKLLAKKILFSFIRRTCDAFLPIGSLNADYYLSYGIPKEKLFQVPYAVDNQYFRSKVDGASGDELRRELALEPGRPVILYASKFMARKKPDDLLEAYVSLSEDGKSEPHPYLLFVGDGEMNEALRARARETGWDSIKFLGFRNQSELPAYFKLCDVFVLPSFHEPWGLVINEVMNAGRAVIVSDQVGCAPDLVKNGENGFVFKAGDVAGLSRALAETLQDPETCKAMGEKSLEIISGWGFREDVEGLKQAIKYVKGEC